MPVQLLFRPQFYQIIQRLLTEEHEVSLYNTFHEWLPSLYHLQYYAISLQNFFSLGYSPSSISSHVTTISYVHKILNLQDPPEAFLVKKIQQGCHHSAPCKDCRLPVTGPFLATWWEETYLNKKSCLKKLQCGQIVKIFKILENLFYSSKYIQEK